jgi:hypothetical protein
MADGLLARTSFYLEENPVLNTLKKIDNEENLRNSIIGEICSNLKINSIADNKKAIIDYIDTELEKSMTLDKKEERNILVKLSNEARLPTDLYQIKIVDNNIKKIYSAEINNEMPLLKETVKMPDLIYNFNYDQNSRQKDISIFAKYYKDKYSFNSFYFIVIGRRNGLNFIIDQAWKLYNDLFLNRPFNDALDLLKEFVNEFGIEMEFHGEISKFFLSAIAKTGNEFKIKVGGKKITRDKKRNTNITVFHFVKNISQSDKNYSLLFAIDLNKYRDYLAKHKSGK